MVPCDVYDPEELVHAALDTRCDTDTCARLRLDDDARPENVLDTVALEQGPDLLTWGGHTVWTAASDGPGRGLDADLLDGIDSSRFMRVGDKAVDADLLDGRDSTDFLGAGDKADDADLLDGMDSDAFLRSAGDVVLDGDLTVMGRLVVGEWQLLSVGRQLIAWDPPSVDRDECITARLGPLAGVVIGVDPPTLAFDDRYSSSQYNWNYQWTYFGSSGGGITSRSGGQGNPGTWITVEFCQWFNETDSYDPPEAVWTLYYLTP